MNDVVALALGGVLLLGAGILIGIGVARSRGRGATSRLEEVQAEYASYREQVTAHFKETAGQFQALGEQYRDLYRHLASGAETLCDTGGETGRLEFRPPPELVHDTDDTRGARAVREDKPASGERAEAPSPTQKSGADAAVPAATPDSPGDEDSSGEATGAPAEAATGPDQEKDRRIAAGETSGSDAPAGPSADHGGEKATAGKTGGPSA